MSGRVVNGARPLMRVLKLSNFPIFQQLKLEERLLRKSSDNWCLLNDGTSPPSIVMGISGKAEKLLEVEKVVKDGVPVIKRFSGGGTVIVDEGTVFITLICSRSALPGLELYPREIMSWTELLYVPVFENALGFKLREHDYVFNDRKFGGNAQSIIKDRWLHHTSFLWDFRDSKMAYLKLPERAPVYREGRNHTDFICRLREHFPSRDIFIDTVQAGLERHFFLREESLVGVESELGEFWNLENWNPFKFPLFSPLLLMKSMMVDLSSPTLEMTVAKVLVGVLRVLMMVGDEQFPGGWWK
ncbi:hypothetical protein R1sor_021008 [Riccia sorocarpa]|uniref:BPL/LPL catalytic domain-containing protein n=1 Tax=Riccia sorocarpa TaxID=122646 RepID=A0ABD3GIQ1_9MARC